MKTSPEDLSDNINDSLDRDRELFKWNLENIAHEFQIRLQSLYVDSELLIKSLRNSKQREIAEDILKGLIRLNVLVQNISVGLGEYDITTIDIEVLINESIDIYLSEAKNKNLSFQVSIEKPSLIEASRSHITHLLHNLIANAVKYSYLGNPQTPSYIRIQGDNKVDWYEILIQNRGVGILPEEAEKIFSKGYRGILTMDERRTGAGLGLTISREIINQHRGKIYVTSDPVGEGSAYLTTIRVLIPTAWEKNKRRINK